MSKRDTGIIFEDLVKQAEHSKFAHCTKSYRIDACKDRDQIFDSILTNPARKSVERNLFWLKYLDRLPLQEELTKCQSLLNGEHYELMEEYDKRMGLLQRMGYIEEDLNLNLKGKILQKLNSPHDLVIVEAFFDGVFQQLGVEELSAVVSVFNRDGKPGKLDKANVTEPIINAINKINDIKTRLLEIEAVLEIPPQASKGFFYNLPSVTFSWAQGVPFFDLSRISQENEGNLIKAMLKTSDLLNTISGFAEVVEDTELKVKCEEAVQKIKRSLVLPNSLYLD